MEKKKLYEKYRILFWLRGVSDTAEPDSAVSLTPLSLPEIWSSKQKFKIQTIVDCCSEYGIENASNYDLDMYIFTMFVLASSDEFSNYVFTVCLHYLRQGRSSLIKYKANHKVTIQ